MTCKDCVHYEVCAEQDAMLGENTIDEIVGVENLCEYFKPKSRFVELPCEVGQTVYALTTDSPTGIEETRVSQIKIKIKENGKISYRISAPCICDDWGEAHWTFCVFDFGKTVFLSKEEAEKALAERSK